MITIHINGIPKQVPPQTSLADLLRTEGYEGKTFAVAINRNIVPKHQHQVKKLMPDDALEILVPAQGG